MEEWQTRRSVAAEEGDQPSGSSSQTGPEPLEHNLIDNDKISPGPKDWLASVLLAERTDQSETQWYGVPHMLRRTHDFEKFFEPRVISFGPYHHGKPHLHQREMLKPLFAQSFLAVSEQDIYHLYRKIDNNVRLMKMCYDKDQTNNCNIEELVRMMLLDGCSLLDLINCSGDENRLCGLNVKSHFIAFVQLDLFLLENQLPFEILNLFEGPKFRAVTLEEMIKSFITSNIMTRSQGMTSELDLVKEPPSHLLGLLQSGLLGPQPESDKKNASLEKDGDRSKGNGQTTRRLAVLSKHQGACSCRDPS